MTISASPPLTITAPIRFSAKADTPSAEKVRYQKTLGNAKNIDADHLSTGSNASPLEVAKWKAQQERGEKTLAKGILLFLASFLSAGMGLQAYSAHSGRETITQIHQRMATAPQEQIPEMQTRLSAIEKQVSENEKFLWVTSLLFLPGIVALLGGKALAHGRRLKKLLAQIKGLEGKLVKVTPQKDAVNQRLVEALNKRIDEGAQQFAQRYQDLYANNPEVRDHFKALFDSADGLPTAENIKQLATYAVYHQILQEQGVSGWEGIQPIQETVYAEKVYSMLRAGQVLGNPFELITDKADAPFGEGFNEMMLGHITAMELKTSREVQQLKGLIEKQVEVERQIALARKALAVSSLSVADHKDKIQQITQVIEAFKVQQQKIETALAQRELPENPDENSVLGINDTLQELMVQLSIAAKEQDHQQQLDVAIETSLAALAKDNAGQASDLPGAQKAKQ